MNRCFLRLVFVLFFLVAHFAQTPAYSLAPVAPFQNKPKPSRFRTLEENQIQARKSSVLVMGYGAIGRNVAAALRREGVGVFVYDSSIDKRQEASQKEFPTLFDVEKFLSWHETAIKNVPLIVADCTPNGVGAKNWEELYQRFPEIRGVVFQGGEKPEIADLNYSSQLSGFQNGKPLRHIRVQPCSIEAMIQIFVPILDQFGLQPIRISNYAVRDGKWKDSFEPFTPYHHKETLQNQIQLYAPELLKYLTMSSVAKSDLDSGYHWNYAEIEAAGISRDKVEGLFQADPRLAVLRLRSGIFDPEEFMRLLPGGVGSGITAVQVVTMGVNKVGIYYAVPHLTNTVPPTLDAVHRLIGGYSEEESHWIVNQNEKILETKAFLERHFAGKVHGKTEWINKYRHTSSYGKKERKKEKLRLIKLFGTCGNLLDSFLFLEELWGIEEDPDIHAFLDAWLKTITPRHFRKCCVEQIDRDVESSI